MRTPELKNDNFLLIKKNGYTADGRSLSARESALALLDVGLWPLWEHTRNRKAIQSGSKVAVYLSGTGNQTVIASATVVAVKAWDRDTAKRYPLELDGTPFAVLHLGKVKVFKKAVSIKPKLSLLSFINSESPKWGVAFMGGTRSVNTQDFELLTRCR